MHEAGFGRFLAGRREVLRLTLALFTLTLTTGVAAQPKVEPGVEGRPGSALLNSERIEQRFGSYGIEVLESGAEYRVSNLYSGTGAQRICRTFAVVRYPPRVDPAFAAEHAAILAGGSIGAVFARAGWRVEKRHLSFGTLAATGRVASLMHIAVDTPLAVHVYVLEIVKGQRRFQYAAIVEIHHPDYLRVADLRTIYGPPNSSGEEALLGTMLTVAKSKMAE